MSVPDCEGLCFNRAYVLHRLRCADLAMLTHCNRKPRRPLWHWYVGVDFHSVAFRVRMCWDVVVLRTLVDFRHGYSMRSNALSRLIFEINHSSVMIS